MKPTTLRDLQRAHHAALKRLHRRRIDRGPGLARAYRDVERIEAEIMAYIKMRKAETNDYQVKSAVPA